MDSLANEMPALQKYTLRVLLIDDQQVIAQAIQHMLKDQKDISFFYCNDPSQAVRMALEIHPTVILQDLVMPDIDGLHLIESFRLHSATKDIPLIALSTEEEPKIKAEAFSLGANDYLIKLPEKIELIARIRYHSAAYIRLLERNEAYQKLEESQRKLNAELQEAANYVMSLLPPPLTGETQAHLSAEWRFIPSTKLGGDAFGYHYLDSENFCFYLLDVCGHGVGAAVLSISIMNVLRAGTLPDTNFHNPEQVLKVLNAKFPMEDHNGMFFTIWYGVYHLPSREIIYSSGGHPPAILMTGPSVSQAKIMELTTPGLVIGGMSEAQFISGTCKVDTYGKLFLFSDGVYEIEKPNGEMFTFHEFIVLLQNHSDSIEEDLDRVTRLMRELNGPGSFADDFSILEIKFD